MIFHQTTNRKRGFTLIEVLIAVAITALLATLMVSITAEVLRIWSQSSTTLTTNSQARIALEIMDRDVQTSMFRPDGRQWFEQGTWPTGSSSGWNPPPADLAIFSQNGVPARSDYLAFFSAGSEGVTLILYRLIDQPLVPNAAGSSIQLVRTEMSARSVLQSIFDLTDNPWGEPFPLGFREMLNKGAIDSENFNFNPSDPDGLVITRDIIATNVIGFRVEMFPDDLQPSEIEIQLVLLSDDGAQQVDNYLAGRLIPSSGQSLPEAVEAVVRRESSTFTQVMYPGFQRLP